MVKIIDIDSLFDKYIEGFVYANIGKVKPEEIENKIKQESPNKSTCCTTDNTIYDTHFFWFNQTNSNTNNGAVNSPYYCSCNCIIKVRCVFCCILKQPTI